MNLRLTFDFLKRFLFEKIEYCVKIKIHKTSNS